MKGILLATLLAAATTVVPARAQVGGIVLDPTQSAHAVQQLIQGSQLYTTTIQTTQNVMGAYNLAQRMATAPTSYYTAYSNMAQQTWTPVAHPANTYGNSLSWTNAATTGNGAAAANQNAGIQRTGQISGYGSLSTQGQQAIAAQGATVDLSDAVNATSLQTIGTVRSNAPQREADIKTLETASHSTDRTCYVAAHQSGDAFAAPHTAGSKPDDAGAKPAADGAAEATAGRAEDVAAGRRRV
jgi:hypothetical protein